MKIFRLALASTGIGALVVGLGLLISNFDKVSGFVKTFIDKFATLRIAVDALTKAWTWLSEAIGLSDTAEEKAAARAEIRKKNSDIRVKQMEREIALLKAQGATEEEIYNKQVQIYRDRIKAETELYNAKRKTGTATREEYEALQDLGNEYAVFIAERQTKLKEEREKELQAQKDKNDKLREEQKKYLTDINNQLTDAKIRNINDSVQREIEAERVALQRKLQAIKGNSASEVALREQLQIESQNKINKIVEDDAKAKSDKEKEERAKEIETSYRDKIASIEASILAGQEGSLSLLNAERELALQQRNQALESDTLTSGERLKIEQEYQNRLLELSKAQQDFEAQLAQQKRDAVVNAAQSTLNALTVIGNLANQNAEKQSAFQKAVAVAGLAINTAQAIGSTIAGATAAAATAGPAFPFVLAGYIASGLATVLTNFATAKKLLGGAGASVNASGASGGGGVQGGTPTNIQTTPNQQVDAKSDINVKAFVVESDMTNAQKQAQKAKQLSEF
jgi:hypothetical protein